LVAGLLLATGLIVAGCGDGDDDTLSKSEFIAKADAICEKGNKEIEAAPSPAGGDRPSQQALEQFATDTLIPNIQKQVNDIRALEPPEEDESQVDAILNSAQTSIDELKADPSKITDEDSFAEANKLARDYGLKVCGEEE
jgi:hypothetical protein